MPPCLLIFGKENDAPGTAGAAVERQEQAAAHDLATLAERPGLRALLLEDAAGAPDLALCRQLHGVRGDVPLIVATAGLSSAALRRDCLAAGASALLPYPYEPRERDLLVDRLGEIRSDAACLEATLRSFYEGSSLLMGIVELTAGDADILHLYDNPATDSFFGTGPARSGPRTARELGVPDEVIRTWTACYRKSEVLGRSVEFEYRHDGGGETRWLSVSVSPIGPAGGEARRFCYVAQDITGHRRVEEALREQQRLYRSITDNASLGLFIMDDRQQCVFMNPAAEKLTGFSLDELKGRPLHDYIHHTHPDGSPYPLADCPIDQAFPKNDRESGEEVFVHKDGHFYDVRFTASPIRDQQGKPTGTVIEVEDVSDRKRAEQQIRLLMREVNHRSKNMLAVVQAMASQSALRGDPQRFAESFTERLHSLAASHDLLVHNDWRGVDLADLASSQLSHFGGASHERIRMAGPDVRLTPAAAQAIGMALHELATNATKYGALSTQDGMVLLNWSVSPPGEKGQFRLRWEEKGGPPVPTPSRSGFGSRLISEMTQLTMRGRARLDYHPTGLVWELTAPIERLAGEEPIL